MGHLINSELINLYLLIKVNRLTKTSFNLNPKSLNPGKSRLDHDNYDHRHQPLHFSLLGIHRISEGIASASVDEMLHAL